MLLPPKSKGPDIDRGFAAPSRGDSVQDEKIIGYGPCTFCKGKGRKEPSGQVCEVCKGSGQMPIYEKKPQ